MRPIYEVWDRESVNAVGEYGDFKSALTMAAAIVAVDPGADLVVAVRDRGDLRVVSDGRDLIAFMRANGFLESRPAVRSVGAFSLPAAAAVVLMVSATFTGAPNPTGPAVAARAAGSSGVRSTTSL